MTADTTGSVHRTDSPRLVASLELTGYLRAAVAVMLAATAVFVAARRLAGALETPLQSVELLAAACMLAGLAVIARAPQPSGQVGAGKILVTLAVIATAAALSLGGSNPGALLGFWAIVLGEETWAWRGQLPKRLAIADPVKTLIGKARPIDSGHESPGAPGLDWSAGAEGSEREPTEPGADVLQQITLRATAEGGQELSGWLRVALAAGQRTGSLHVAFCPAFDQTPTVGAEPVAGPDCRIKAAQILPYGVRLEVKLYEAANEGESVLLWFHAASDG
jgi:hypothetical protein